jgi:hypothetical protein
VSTSTPGFTAKILAGSSPSSGFQTDSASRTVGRTTTFTLTGKTAQYYVVWITQLPPGGSAKIEDVRAR